MGERASFLCERCQRQTEVPFLRPINSNLLHSDYIPCETEVSQTTELLEEEARELKQLENDIAPLRRILEQMEAGKRRLEAQIAQRQSILSVQRRVPVELWGNIFAFACSFSSRDGYFLDIQDLEIDDYHMPEVLSMFPVTLSYVCSRWKAIATGCPKLWSSIRVEVFSKFSRREMFLVETFLDNSAGFPLNMAIIVPVTWLNDRPLDNYCLSIWELLTGQFSRCERLSIHVDNLRTLSTLKQPDLSFNNLKAFHFTTRTDRLEFNINIPFWQAIRQVPKLAELHAQAPLLLLCLVPISQLTTMTLNLEGVSNIADILPVLESARQLRSLTVLPGTDCEFNATKIRRVEMPSLRTLILLEDYPSIDSWDFSHGELFSSLVMPNLFAFKLSFRRSLYFASRWPPWLLATLKEASSSLRHLSLFLDPVYDRSWEPIFVLLKTTPHLTRFDFGGKVEPDSTRLSLAEAEYRRCCRTEKFSRSYIRSSLASLTYTPQNTLVPDLESISLVRIQSYSQLLSEILDMATSRSPGNISAVTGVRPLKELCIEYYDEQDSPVERYVLEGIKDLEADGMKVVTTKLGSWGGEEATE